MNTLSWTTSFDLVTRLDTAAESWNQLASELGRMGTGSAGGPKGTPAFFTIIGKPSIS
jgi:hypothetical protein